MRILQTNRKHAARRLLMRRVGAFILAGSAGVWGAQAFAQQGCSDGASADYDRGMDALGDGDSAQAADLLSKAAAQCDSPAYWLALGDAQNALLAMSDAHSGEGLNQQALEAYGRAFASARTQQDDQAGARAARAITDLGLQNGDPLKAQNWLLVASNLEPQHPDLPDLQGRLDSARDELSTSEIDTGLSNTRGIGTVSSLLGGKVSSNAFWDPDDESSGGAGNGSASVSGSIVTPMAEMSALASVDLPIRFESNSTELTAATAASIRNLARVLTAKSAENRVTLTGHADVRGDANYNQVLSLARAEAIRDLLVTEEPSLDGRIDTLGAGESRPIDLGDSARSHANNRRLEVRLVAPTQ